MPELNPNEFYTTSETQKILKVSSSTMKRLLKRGFIRANKIGGQYRILGHEILKVVSPSADREATNVYQKIKTRVKNKVKEW